MQGPANAGLFLFDNLELTGHIRYVRAVGTTRRKHVRKPTIPPAIEIAGRQWEIQLVKGLSRREAAVGLCEHEDLLISLDSELTGEELELTLVHEILHAIWPKKVCSSAMEEKIILKLEKRILELLRQGVLLRSPR